MQDDDGTKVTIIPKDLQESSPSYFHNVKDSKVPLGVYLSSALQMQRYFFLTQYRGN